MLSSQRLCPRSWSFCVAFIVSSRGKGSAAGPGAGRPHISRGSGALGKRRYVTAWLVSFHIRMTGSDALCS